MSFLLRQKFTIEIEYSSNMMKLSHKYLYIPIFSNPVLCWVFSIYIPLYSYIQQSCVVLGVLNIYTFIFLYLAILCCTGGSLYIYLYFPIFSNPVLCWGFPGWSIYARILFIRYFQVIILKYLIFKEFLSVHI